MLGYFLLTDFNRPEIILQPTNIEQALRAKKKSPKHNSTVSQIQRFNSSHSELNAATATQDLCFCLVFNLCLGLCLCVHACT